MYFCLHNSLCRSTDLDPNLILSNSCREVNNEYISTYAHKNLKLKAFDVNFIT